MIDQAWEREAWVGWVAMLQAATSATIATVAAGHIENQNSLLTEGTVK